MLGDKPVHGIVTQAGSQTSHAAIIARSWHPGRLRRNRHHASHANG
ncbi:MAG: PEP-utilizing enzyme [Pirellulaceae bacterium]